MFWSSFSPVFHCLPLFFVFHLLYHFNGSFPLEAAIGAKPPSGGGDLWFVVCGGLPTRISGPSQGLMCWARAISHPGVGSLSPGPLLVVGFCQCGPALTRGGIPYTDGWRRPKGLCPLDLGPLPALDSLRVAGRVARLRGLS